MSKEPPGASLWRCHANPGPPSYRPVRPAAVPGWGAWHLAVDPAAGEDTTRRYHFSYRDHATVNRAALIHAKQRASQNDHPEIERAVDELPQRLDARS